MHMSALGLPGYHLHAAYAGDWQLSPTEVRAPPHLCQLPRPCMDVGLEKEEMWMFSGRSFSNYVLCASSEWERVERYSCAQRPAFVFDVRQGALCDVPEIP